MGDANSPSVSKADEYRHPDGTTEVVYAVDDGAVLTIRAYESVEGFERAVADAEYLGEHPGVADLPDPGELDDSFEE